MSSNGEQLHMDVRAADKRMWLHIRDVARDQEWPCWLQLQGRVAREFSMRRTEPYPTAIITASWIQGREQRGNDAVGTVGLATAIT